MHLTAYTDGACSGNPGPGGWGFVVKFGETTIEHSGGNASTTNQRMELTAALELLKTLQHTASVFSCTIFSDSQYLVKGMTEWVAGWKAKGWRTAGMKPVANLDLWLELDRLANEFALFAVPITWQWVKGHAGDPGNEHADRLATAAIPR